MPGTKQLYPGPPGSVLHDARISAGKTVLETAEALNLLNSYVEALEENDYSRFNSPLFARGYIKSYARFLGLDEVPLLNDCDRICKREEQGTQRRQAHIRGKVQAPGHAGFILALFTALVVWSLSCWVFGGSEPKELSVVVLNEQFPELATLKKAPSLGESLLSGGLVKVQSEDLSEQVLESAELEFIVSEDVWLEVRDGHNNVAVSGVQSKGEALNLSVDGPVTVSTSYWPVLAIYYNGRLVEIKELASSNVVRVQVGEL
ncbi:helix-turn-helix domain-containing protein [Zhongshania aliphaticivorans]|uniref:helix-turn-helix domain-containing protein n=1 Tax=Zhongshania aliphaticivorans TaxID=1470434 RepID=UPI0012E5D0F3|nr:RodZ domain-containing protein [Zhongshania aliphaticivorans]CAA0083232.1 Cytoskeleton protein RodZ [Zhongshania aliphaticivorans]